MALLTMLGNRWLFIGTREDNIRAKSVPGWSYNKQKKHITFTIERRIYKDLLSVFPELDVDDRIKSRMNAVEKNRINMIAFKTEEPELKTGLRDTLFDYQKHGVHYMSNVTKCINADDMGCGKTLQTIATVDEIGAKKILIVCPNTLKLNWRNEIKKWLGREDTVILGGKSKQKYEGTGFCIVNYESVWSRKTSQLKPEFNIEWDVVVFDEAHRLKNRKAKQTKACKKLKAERMYMLTGTPIENRPDDIWSILNLLYPDVFNSYHRFVDQWCETDECYIGRRDPIKVITGCSDPAGLNDMLNPLMLRRRKEDVLDELPEKIYMTIPVELSPADRKIYDKLEEELIAQLPSGDVVAAPSVLTQSIRLRQIAISHKLLDAEPNKLKSSKIEALMDFVADNEEAHKIVVFSQFRASLEVIKSRYKGKYLEVHGGVCQEERDKNVKKFDDDESIRLILCTIQAAGVGLTLTASDTVVFLDKHYNPQINRQAEDRCYRIGQKNVVRVVSIIAENTIEQRIENLLADKRLMSDEIIDRKG
jgi:SNF2 family DNA or RNA helicase